MKNKILQLMSSFNLRGVGDLAPPRITLQLALIRETAHHYILSSDYAQARVPKVKCERLGKYQFRMPEALAVEKCLDMGAT